MAELYIPHVGWLAFDDGDDVAKFLSHGWFEYREQAFLWLFLRPGDWFIDCGAHVGLFTMLASRITNGDVNILAIEPNPQTLTYLRNNLLSCHTDKTEVIAGAALNKSGKANLSVGKEGRSAYSSVEIEVSRNTVSVDTFTIDDLLESRGIEKVQFMKLDVEGAEQSVLSGALKSVKAGRLPVVMVEFTESTLNQMGMSTGDLRASWEAVGYRFYRLDEEELRLTPYVFDGAIRYENLFAVMNPDAVNQRLENAESTQRRIATEIINRCGAASRHFDRCITAEATARTALAELRESYNALKKSYFALKKSHFALKNSKRMKLTNKILAPLDWFRPNRKQ